MEHIKKRKGQSSSLLQTFDEDNELFRMRVGKDRSVHSYNIMVRARGYVADFLQSWEHREDIPLEELQLEFLQRFSIYLSVERNLHRGTIWLNCMMLKGVVQRRSRGAAVDGTHFLLINRYLCQGYFCVLRSYRHVVYRYPAIAEIRNPGDRWTPVDSLRTQEDRHPL